MCIRDSFRSGEDHGRSQHGGAIDAAVFLHQFARQFPWVHLDISPRILPEDTELLAKGASGAGVRLLIKLVEECDLADEASKGRHNRHR